MNVAHGVFRDDVGIGFLSFHSPVGADVVKKFLHAVLQQSVNQSLQQRELANAGGMIQKYVRNHIHYEFLTAKMN